MLTMEQLKQAPPAYVATVHHFSAGVYAREMRLLGGMQAITHAHKYDHLSILAAGIAVVKAGDSLTTYHAPACIEIKAGIPHSILAIEDVTWFCIHATDETDEAKLDEVLIE